MTRDLPGWSRALVVGFICSLLLVVLFSWMSLRTRPGAKEHADFDLALRELVTLDAQLNEQVAESRMGLTNHFDDLVRSWDLVRGVQGRLERVPSRLRGPNRQQLQSELEGLREALVVRGALLERYKTSHAILRNAERALPFSVERLEVELDAQPGQGALRGHSNAVLLQAIAPSPARELRARCALELLSGAPVPACVGAPVELGALPPPVQEVVAGLRQQGGLLLEWQPRVDAVMHELLSASTGDDAARALSIYRGAHRAALVRSGGYAMLLLLSLGLALSLGSALVVTRYRADARAMRSLSQQLEHAMHAVRRERDREKELAQLKNRFVSMTSHEFRTPLSVIMSSAELLLAYSERWDQSRRHKHLKRIMGASSNMSGMIERVLLIGRAEAEQVAPNPAPVDLCALVEQIAQEVCASAAPGRTLERSCEALATPLLIDEQLFRHALSNLLTNAFKYSPDHTTVQLRVQADQESLQVEVQDQGIGVPPQDLELLFEPFHRGSNAAELPGTGLGLAIVRQSVQRHGGRVQVHSPPGGGTTFKVHLPVLRESV